MTINAARAEVEPMAEPRNPAHVLGVGSEIQAVKGPVFAAYFAASRDRFDAEPNYKGGLFVLVDGAVYGCARKASPPPCAAASARASSRCCAAIARSAASSIPGPGTANRSCPPSPAMRSRDFLREMSVMVRAYG